MIDVGTTGNGALGSPAAWREDRHADPSAIDGAGRRLFPIRIVMAHPGWPWATRPPRRCATKAVHECRAGRRNIFRRASRSTAARLQDKIMFGSDYPSLPYGASSGLAGARYPDAGEWRRSSTRDADASSAFCTDIHIGRSQG